MEETLVVIARQKDVYLQEFLAFAEQYIAPTKLKQAHALFLQKQNPNYAEDNTCQYVYQKGARKGTWCQHKVAIGKFCRRHSKVRTVQKAIPQVPPVLSEEEEDTKYDEVEEDETDEDVVVVEDHNTDEEEPEDEEDEERELKVVY